MEVSQLWDKMKNSIEDLNVSAMDGRQRKKHLLQKAISLGGKPGKSVHEPRNIRVGKMVKDKKRRIKERDEIRLTEGMLASKRGVTNSDVFRNRK